MPHPAAPAGIDGGARGGVLQLLCVGVAGRRCGVPTDVVVEVHPAVQLAPLPDAPPAIVGIVNRRGSALPVLDLRRRLGLPTRQVQLDDRLVVLQAAARDIGLLVDAAVDVIDVPGESVDRAIASATDSFLSEGVALLADGLLVVLDVDAFLSSDDVVTLEQALERTRLGGVS